MKFTELFSSKIDPLKVEVNQKRFIQAFVSIGAVSMLTTAILAPSQPKKQLGWEWFMASVFGFSSAYISRKREDVESRYAAFLAMNKENFKEKISGEFAYESAKNTIASELNLARDIRELPIEAQQRYEEQFQLSGLVALRRKEIESEEVGISSDRSSGKRNNTAIPDVTIQNTFINRDIKSILTALSQQYPQLLKIDPGWVMDLIETSTCQDMSRRTNHSFYLCGETQSGKSTLAGVLVSGIASRSEIPAIVAGHDAKKEKDGLDITDWLCDFTYKIDGLSETQRWCDLATNLIKNHVAKVSKIGKSLFGVPEFILLQDEVDTIYGAGKGFADVIDEKLANKMKGQWMAWIKMLAGLKGHVVFMGQSPLTQDNGINKPSLKNLCFICLNATSDYILKNHSLYMSHVSDDEIECLKQFCALLEEAGLRYALVRPMSGKPFVAVVPVFSKDDDSDFEDDLNSDFEDGLNNEDTTDIKDAHSDNSGNDYLFNEYTKDSKDSDETADDSGSIQSNQSLIQDDVLNGETNNKSKPDLYDHLIEWYLDQSAKGVELTEDHLKLAWFKLTNTELKPEALVLLIQIIEKKLGTIK